MAPLFDSDREHVHRFEIFFSKSTRNGHARFDSENNLNPSIYTGALLLKHRRENPQIFFKMFKTKRLVIWQQTEYWWFAMIFWFLESWEKTTFKELKFRQIPWDLRERLSQRFTNPLSGPEMKIFQGRKCRKTSKIFQWRRSLSLDFSNNRENT